MKSNSELALEARGIAKALTYNEAPAEAAAKHMLLEMAHRLDTADIRVHKKQDGLLVINGIGKARFMSFFEGLRYRLFGVVPARV